MTELQSVSLKEAQMDNLAVPIQQSKVFLAQEAKQRVTDTPFTNKGTKTYQLARIINGKKKTMQLKFFVSRLILSSRGYKHAQYSYLMHTQPCYTIYL